jgi:xylan 1,4-beta-xylosidase
MANRFGSIPQETIRIDTTDSQGAYEWWRHTIGHGGINSLPLPDKVIAGSKKLMPRLVRTFIQQYFDIYPEHGQFDWSILDPYMDSLAATGGKVVAAITIKPKVLFPNIDQYDVMPNDSKEWQHVIYELVKRYSVERPIVTYWEIGNEPDIGENGGCPYYFRTAEQYNEFYRMTIEPILAAFPAAKVGGPALANAASELMVELIKYCRENTLQLDFVSWHLYNSDPLEHKLWVEKIKGYLSVDYGTYPRPEMLITEWNNMFDALSIEELAYSPERAAMAAAGIMAMMDAGLDYSFYYHVWDQANYIHEFEPFFADVSIMTKHWNEVPHRFGLFGVEGEVRPQYFVYQMFSRMGEEKLRAHCEDNHLWVQAARMKGQISVMAANYSTSSSRDLIVNLEFEHLAPGRRMLKVYRIDDKRSWSSEELELIPVEQREIDAPGKFMFQIYSPNDSVTMVTLSEI